MTPPTRPEPGMLLLAAPTLLDPNFVDSVILLLDVNDQGALGVVLNRPSALPVAEVLGEWGDVVEEPEVLFQGGPVSTDGALAVALATPGGQDAVGFQAVVDRAFTGERWLGLLDLDTPAELVVGTVDRLRIFAGYAGWGAGQLQDEIEEGAWYVVPALPEDVFRSDTQDLWRDVMRRQPGDLAFHSTRPTDPEMN
ncbi:MAG TPA: YqgE/AlgH family protein [Nocardioides sp.]|nr:YqgE/AlgH family protein [Nocardioides sp.]